ncbi:MAG: ABC transporter substrate-binding protein, partial [Devosia sp.]
MTERAFRRLALAAMATSLSAIALATPVLAQQTTVRIWTPQTAGYQEWIEWANTAIKEVDPTLDIVLETFPNEPYKTMVQVGAASEDGPDIFFNWAGEVTASMVRDGLVLDISAFGDGEGGYKASIPASLLGFFAYDGKQYGVPMQAVTKYFYYNTAKFEELGLAVPQTMTDLIAMCGAIRTVDPSLTPISIGNSGPWQTVHYMTMLNERVLGVAGTAPDYDLSNADDQLFTNPGYTEAWQILADMRDADCFQPAPNATTPEAGEAMFTSEVALMNYCGSWCTSIFNAEGFGGKYKMFRMPA